MATWGELEKAGTKWRDLEEMTWGELEEFCVINPKTKQIPDDMEVSFVPMQSVSDTGAVQTDEVRKASEVKKGFTFFEEGDVLFAKITPCMENGKGGIARGLKNGVGFGSTEFHVLHPAPEKVSSEWLYYLTSWDEFRKQCARNMTGSAGQKRVPKSYLEHYKVHLPSLEEQRRIAAVLDKVSGLIAKRREQLDKLDDLVKARFVEMFGDCKTNPKGWETCCLEEIAEVGSSKRVFVEELKDEGIPFYRGTEVGALAGGMTIIPELFITEEHYKDLCEMTGKPKKGDLLMPSICPDGRIWLVDTDDPFYFKDGRVLWVHGISNKFDPVFLLYTLKDRIMTDYSSIASGTTFAELKIFALKKCQVFNTPIEVQKKFSAFISNINRSKLTIQQSLDKLEVMKKALMQKYFG